MSLIKNTKFNSDDLSVILIILCIIITQTFIVYISPFSLSGDEAFYWLWSKRLDLCFYEKGPGIAYLIYLTTSIFGDTEIGVRAGAFISQFLISILLYFFFKNSYSRETSIKSLTIYWSSLFFGSLGMFITCDPPLCLLWVVSIIAAHKAIEKDNPSYWILSFLSIGLAALFKYSSVILVPFYVLFLIINKKYRKHLLTVQFVISTIFLIASFLPVVIWNMKNNWINFTKLSGHFESKKRVYASGIHFFELIGGQLGLVGPIIFPILIYILYVGYREWRKGDVLAGLYVFCSLPLAILCILMSLQKRVYANWPMPLYLSLIMLFAYLLNAGHLNRLNLKLLKRGLILNFSVLLISHLLFTGYSFGIPVNILPTKKLTIGRDLGKEVDEKIINEGFSKCKNNGSSSSPIIISDKYTQASLIAFYSKYFNKVHVADPSEAKFSQFDLWQDWEKLNGTNALLVFSEENEVPYFYDLFDAIYPIGNSKINYGKEQIGKFNFFIACSYNGKKIPNVTMLESSRVISK